MAFSPLSLSHCLRLCTCRSRPGKPNALHSPLGRIFALVTRHIPLRLLVSPSFSPNMHRHLSRRAGAKRPIHQDKINPHGRSRGACEGKKKSWYNCYAYIPHNRTPLSLSMSPFSLPYFRFAPSGVYRPMGVVLPPFPFPSYTPPHASRCPSLSATLQNAARGHVTRTAYFSGLCNTRDREIEEGLGWSRLIAELIPWCIHVYLRLLPIAALLCAAVRMIHTTGKPTWPPGSASSYSGEGPRGGRGLPELTQNTRCLSTRLSKSRDSRPVSESAEYVLCHCERRQKKSRQNSRQHSCAIRLGLVLKLLFHHTIHMQP
jgi:hypothetical protein